ncbi:MAG: response regulator transcription factor [Saprospiraceae bacterium]
MANRILLVEDDRNFGDVLRSYLEINEYDVTLATDGEQGLDCYNKGEFDLCIFDVMMPKKDGFTLAAEIREKDTAMPIIFLTARGVKEDILKGFKIGADDYITKPFNSEELLLRIHAILKRSKHTSEVKEDVTEFNIGKYHFHYPFRMLVYAPKALQEVKEKLSPKEAQLLKMFAMRLNDILPRSEALTKIWGEDNYFTARSMDVFVTKLRKYLRFDEQIEIVNIHGNGFQLLVRSSEEAH